MASFGPVPFLAQHGSVTGNKAFHDHADEVAVLTASDAFSTVHAINPAFQVLHDSTELWKALRTSVEEDAATLVSQGPPTVALECLRRIIRGGAIPDEVQQLLKHSQIHMETAYTTHAAFDDSLAAALAQSSDAKEVAQRLVTNLEDKIKQYRGDFHYRVVRRTLMEMIALEGDLVSFLDLPAGAIEYIMATFIKHAIPHFNIEGINLAEAHLLDKAVFNTSHASKLAPVLLIGALNDDLLWTDSDVTAMSRIRQLEIEHNCVFINASDYLYDGDQFRAIVAIAKMEQCLIALSHTGMWNVLAGDGTYPYHWNDVAISALAQSKSLYASYLRQYAIEAQLSLSHGEDPEGFDTFEIGAQAIAIDDGVYFGQTYDVDVREPDWNSVAVTQGDYVTQGNLRHIYTPSHARELGWNNVVHAEDYVNEVAVHSYDLEVDADTGAEANAGGDRNTEEAQSPWDVADASPDVVGSWADDAKEQGGWPDVVGSWDDGVEEQGGWPDIVDTFDAEGTNRYDTWDDTMEQGGWPDVVSSWNDGVEEQGGWPDVVDTFDADRTDQHDSWFDEPATAEGSWDAPAEGSWDAPAEGSWDAPAVEHDVRDDHGVGSSADYEDNLWSGPQPASSWQDTEDSWTAGDKTWDDNTMSFDQPASDWDTADPAWAQGGQSFEDNLVVTEDAELSWGNGSADHAHVTSSWDDTAQAVDGHSGEATEWDNAGTWEDGVAPQDTASDEGYHSEWNGDSYDTKTSSWDADNTVMTRDFADNGETSWAAETAVNSTFNGDWEGDNHLEATKSTATEWSDSTLVADYEEDGFKESKEETWAATDGDNHDTIDWNNVTAAKPRVHFTDDIDAMVHMKARAMTDFNDLMGRRRASIV